jgi:hypothetical protein
MRLYHSSKSVRTQDYADEKRGDVKHHPEIRQDRKHHTATEADEKCVEDDRSNDEAIVFTRSMEQYIHPRNERFYPLVRI